MKWILLGAVLAVLLFWPAALSFVAAVVAYLTAQPSVLTFTLGAVTGPAIARRVRGWL